MRGGKRKCWSKKNSHTPNDVVQNRPRPWRSSAKPPA